jgi:uncharacterized protein
MSEQVVIDSLAFAGKAESLHGKIPVSSLTRLHDALYSTRGEIEFDVRGGTNSMGRPVLRLHISGEVQLQCQRCLEEMDFPLAIDSDLLLARDEAELAGLDENEEGPDAILAEAEMDVGALIEDEVLLAIPMSPRHPAGACSAKGDGAEAGTQGKIFEALEMAKKRLQDKSKE